MPIVQDPIDWLSVENGVYQWFREQANIEIIYGNQYSPQPPYPYGSITIISGPNPVTAFDERTYTTNASASAGEEVEVVSSGERTFTCSLQVYVGPPDSVNPMMNARAIMSRVQSSMGAQSVVDYFRSIGVAIYGQQAIQNIDEAIEDTWISRCNMDIVLGVVSSVAEKYGYIKETLISAPPPIDYTDRQFGDT